MCFSRYFVYSHTFACWLVFTFTVVSPGFCSSVLGVFAFCFDPHCWDAGARSATGGEPDFAHWHKSLKIRSLGSSHEITACLGQFMSVRLLNLTVSGVLTN